MSQRIAQFAAFMDRAGRFRRDVAGNPVGPGKLAEQPLQSVPAALDRWIALRVRTFEIAVRHDARTAVARTDDVDHVQIIVFDQPIEMDVKEIQSCRRSPMPEQPRLDMFELEGRFPAADFLAGRSDRPKDNSPRASRRAFSGADRAIMYLASDFPNAVCCVHSGGAHRIGCPCDQFCRDACEGVIEGGDGRGRVRLVELLALLKQARSDDLSILVQDSRGKCRSRQLARGLY